MARPRGLDKNFLAAMRAGLEKGRARGYDGWDLRFEHCAHGVGVDSFLFRELEHEIIELALAVKSGDEAEILKEAADVANRAMMVAEDEGALP